MVGLLVGGLIGGGSDCAGSCVGGGISGMGAGTGVGMPEQNPHQAIDVGVSGPSQSVSPNMSLTSTPLPATCAFQAHKACLKDCAPQNIELMFAARETSHDTTSWLKAVAP